MKNWYCLYGILVVFGVSFGLGYYASVPLNWLPWLQNASSQSFEFSEDKMWYIVTESVDRSVDDRNVIWNLENKGFQIVWKHKEANGLTQFYLGAYLNFEQAYYAAQLIDITIKTTIARLDLYEHF